MSSSDIDLIRQGKDPFNKGGAVGGKSSISKRHMKKQKRSFLEEEDEDPS